MTFDSERGVVVLYGGRGTNGILSDTWEFDGKSWELVSDGEPDARESHAMTFDSNRGVVVLYGGVLEDPQARREYTWEWNGLRWVVGETEGFGERRRIAPAMIYDEVRDETVLFGGIEYGRVRDDTQIYRGQHGFVEQPQTQAAVKGSEVTFHVEVRAPEGATYQWIGRGQWLNDGGSIQGAKTDTLRLSNIVEQYDGGYYCLVWHPGCPSQSSTPARLYVLIPEITLTTVCPRSGDATLSWRHCSPNGTVTLLAANGPGNVRIPGGYPCAGTYLGLGSDWLRVLDSAQSDANGEGAIVSRMPVAFCGKYIQLIDRTACAMSNVVEVR
jgi:hypothetical protein